MGDSGNIINSIRNVVNPPQVGYLQGTAVILVDSTRYAPIIPVPRKPRTCRVCSKPVPECNGYLRKTLSAVLV